MVADRRAALGLALLLSLLAACGDDDDPRRAPTATATQAATATLTATLPPPSATATVPPATATATTTDTLTPTVTATPTVAQTATPTVPELFTGSVDDFYVVPDPLPPGEPGALIRVQTVASSAEHTDLRIMYHSRDAQGRDRAVTGILSYPNTAAPDGGRPVVSLAHGTTGIASQCAPSRAGGAAPTFAVDGVGVATDYIGLGPVGELHPYLSRLSEGHSVIDAVRAARNYPAAGAGAHWLAIGHSQGGHGALAAHELGASYAPELELLGTVSIAPAAMFGNTYGPLDELVVRIVSLMALYGGSSDYPEIDPFDYIGPPVAAAIDVLEESCLTDIILAFAGIPAESFYLQHPFTTEPARSITLANDVGRVRVDAPLLLISGTADTTVFVDRVRDLLDRLCETGQVTEYLEIEGATHDNEAALARPQIQAWLAARLAGDPPIDSCPAAP